MGKVLIHYSYAYAYGNDYPAWGKAMAGKLKVNMKLGHLTLDKKTFFRKVGFKIQSFI